MKQVAVSCQSDGNFHSRPGWLPKSGHSRRICQSGGSGGGNFPSCWFWNLYTPEKIGMQGVNLEGEFLNLW